MIRLLAILAVLLTVQVAWAQEAAEDTTDGDAAAAVERAYLTYVADGYGFALDLPDSGEVSGPADDGWDKEDQVAFEWIGSDTDPVRMIQGRVDSFGKELDGESFDMFCTALLQNWASDEELFEVTTANEKFRFGDHTWNLIEVTDRSNAASGPLAAAAGDEGQIVYYSVFSTYAGDQIYTVTMYYLEPVSDEVEELGVPILRSFAFAS
jgi:hypothetical protein